MTTPLSPIRPVECNLQQCLQSHLDDNELNIAKIAWSCQQSALPYKPVWS